MIARRTLGAIALAAATRPARAQGFPNGPVRIVVPNPPGGSADLICRVLGDKVGAELGQPVVIENRPGGGTSIGTQYVARSRPDGQTVLLVQAFNVIAALLQPNLPYDLMRDFVPVVGVGFFPLVIAVKADTGIRSLADLAAAGRAREGGLAFASGGVGSLGHLSGASLVNALGVPGTHVPYRGNADAMQALVAGQVQVFVPTTADALQLARAGTLRLLAVTTDERLPALPDIPTVREIGIPEVAPRTWFGYLLPAATPAPIVDRLREVFTHAVTDGGVQERLGAVSFNTRLQTGPQLAAFMAEESARWGGVIRRNAITAND